jgi:hypothetical protein
MFGHASYGTRDLARAQPFHDVVPAHGAIPMAKS